MKIFVKYYIQILHIIKDEGSLSTMHTLLVYLQTAREDRCPVVAGLLLQLDLLVWTARFLKKFLFTKLSLKT